MLVGTRTIGPNLWSQVLPYVPRPVRRVLVLGAFFDKSLGFLKTIARELRPKDFVVAIDPESVEITHKAPSVLPGGRFVDASDLGDKTGYLHAKALVVQGVRGDELFVTGSANPSAPAWLSGADTRNVEMVVVQRSERQGSLSRLLGLQALCERSPIEPAVWNEMGRRTTARAQVGSLFSADAWNNVTFTAGEVKNPSRNLPLSLALGTGVVIALYIACNFIYLTALPLDGAPGAATILGRGIKYAAEERVGTAVMTQMFGAVGGLLMAAAIMISGFGCNNGLILSGARVYYAMAKDGLFFRKVAKLHPTYKTPAVSLMVQMVWTCVLCISGSYGQLLDYIIFAVLVFYILTIVGLFVLRRTHPNAERPYKAVGYPVLPAIYVVMALFIDVVLLRYKPQYTWPGLIVVLLGIPVYYAWSRSARQGATGASA